MNNYELVITDEFMFDELFDIDFIGKDALKIYHGNDISFEENLKNFEKFKEDKELYLEGQYDFALLKGDFSHYDQSKRIWEYFENNFSNILELVDYIVLNLEGDDLTFIENHPVLKGKNIVIPYRIDITDIDTVIKLSKKFKNIPNIYVKLQGNTEYVRLDNCMKIINEIKSRADYIKGLNLSPAESVMLAYDVVRERVYTKEKTANALESRDIKDALFGESIVCVGYARILSCILDYLGIDNELVHLDNIDNDRGHLRNAINIKDSKYNIDGYYYLDATWDSKRKDSELYLYKYLYFMKTWEEMTELEERQDIYYKYADGEKDIDIIINKINDLYEDNDPESFFKFMNLAININSLYKKAYHTNEKLLNISNVSENFTKIKENVDKDELINQLILIKERLNNSIDAETMIKLVNNVRKIEYYLNSEKYPYSLDVLYNIYLKSEWIFSEKHFNPNDLMLCRIFGQNEESIYNPDKDFINFVLYDAKIEKEPEQVVLTKTLSKISTRRI